MQAHFGRAGQERLVDLVHPGQADAGLADGHRHGGTNGHAGLIGQPVARRVGFTGRDGDVERAFGQDRRKQLHAELWPRRGIGGQIQHRQAQHRRSGRIKARRCHVQRQVRGDQSGGKGRHHAFGQGQALEADRLAELALGHRAIHVDGKPHLIHAHRPHRGFQRQGLVSPGHLQIGKDRHGGFQCGLQPSLIRLDHGRVRTGDEIGQKPIKALGLIAGHAAFGTALGHSQDEGHRQHAFATRNGHFIAQIARAGGELAIHPARRTRLRRALDGDAVLGHLHHHFAQSRVDLGLLGEHVAQSKAVGRGIAQGLIEVAGQQKLLVLGLRGHRAGDDIGDRDGLIDLILPRAVAIVGQRHHDWGDGRGHANLGRDLGQERGGVERHLIGIAVHGHGHNALGGAKISLEHRQKIRRALIGGLGQGGGGPQGHGAGQAKGRG